MTEKEKNTIINAALKKNRFRNFFIGGKIQRMGFGIQETNPWHSF